ncbi:uncharacterized protein BYT42DRAFT_493548, partial [Radiomyces spectabilis]|uniref:uncharacterized protein n=1 Tax=Radiomyces spectabilis TaxID=64574 RepID=UPI00221F8D68
IDFLPYTCYHCKKIFCQEHFKLDDHHCPSLEDPTLDVRVPTCPICEKPVPGPRGEDPNIRVNRHIQNNCADPTSKSPGNICHLRGCKAKLLVPIQCPDCGQSYCVKHRLGADHQCQGRPAAPAVSKAPHQLAGLAAIRRAAKNGMRHNQSNTTSKMESER